MDAYLLESQHEFITSNSKKAFFLGGVGCVHPDTRLDVVYNKKLPTIISKTSCSISDIKKDMDNGFDVEFRSFNGIDFDYRQSLGKPFHKGHGPMYRVITEEGEITVYEKHEFLCSDLNYRYPTCLKQSLDQGDNLLGLFSINPDKFPHNLFEDIYLLLDRLFKWIKWLSYRGSLFKMIVQSFTGKLFDPTLDHIIKLTQGIVEAIQENPEIFSVRSVQYHMVSHPFKDNQLVHFHNEFCYELARLGFELLPSIKTGNLDTKRLKKNLDHLIKIWDAHDFRHHPTEKSRNKVLAVESVGDGEYWDIQIPDTHNYVAHGMVHHNSGKTYTDGDLALRMAQEFPYTKGLLTAPTHQQLINSTVMAMCERWEELGLIRGVDYKVVASGSRKRIDILGQEILLYSLSNDVPAKGITVGYWIGDESTYVKKKRLIPVGRD